MNAADRINALATVEFLLDQPGADTTWTASDQVLGAGQVVTVTVRAVVTPAALDAMYPQRYVVGAGQEDTTV